MPDVITEALLEMHYHHALVQMHQSAHVHGIKYTLLKPSQPDERWVGFDQGWTVATISTSALLQQLKVAIQKQSTQVAPLIFGYFLQFKVVKELKRSSANKPKSFTTPYYRVDLELDPNPTTRVSQHETLARLAKVHNTSVHYACPMFFDLSDIMRPPDLSTLITVDLRSAPPGWMTGAKHHLMFQDKSGANPMWASTPVPAVARSGLDWYAQYDVQQSKSVPELERNLERWVYAICEGQSDGLLHYALDEPTRVLPPSLRLLIIGASLVRSNSGIKSDDLLES